MYRHYSPPCTPFQRRRIAFRSLLFSSQGFSWGYNSPKTLFVSVAFVTCLGEGRGVPWQPGCHCHSIRPLSAMAVVLVLSALKWKASSFAEAVTSQTWCSFPTEARVGHRFKKNIASLPIASDCKQRFMCLNALPDSWPQIKEFPPHNIQY